MAYAATLLYLLVVSARCVCVSGALSRHRSVACGALRAARAARLSPMRGAPVLDVRTSACASTRWRGRRARMWTSLSRRERSRAAAAVSEGCGNKRCALRASALFACIAPLRANPNPHRAPCPYEPLQRVGGVARAVRAHSVGPGQWAQGLDKDVPPYMDTRCSSLPGFAVPAWGTTLLSEHLMIGTGIAPLRAWTVLRTTARNGSEGIDAARVVSISGVVPSYPPAASCSCPAYLPLQAPVPTCTSACASSSVHLRVASRGAAFALA